VLPLLCLLSALSACASTGATAPRHDPRLTADCRLVPLPDGVLRWRDYERVLAEQWSETADCNARLRALR
jgi:hypothetical protein